MKIIQENKIRETKFKWRIIVLYAIIFAQSFLPSDIFSPFLVLVGFFLLIISHGKIKISCFNFIKPLLVVFLIGIIGLFGHDAHHIFRDISYALTPISLIYTGFWMAENKKMWPGILKTLIIGGTIIAGIHLSKIILNPELLNAGFLNIRMGALNPNIGLVILSLVLGIFQNRLKLGKLFPRLLPRFISLPLLLLSFTLTFSRTGLIMGIMLATSLLGLIGRINLRTILTIVTLIGGFFLLVLSTPTDEVGTIRSKITGSVTELVVSDYTVMTDITKSWRGFETYRGIITFESGNMIQHIIGQGFGSLVDLGFTMTLAGVDFNKIPVLHNGYAYILVKTGLLGILCYAFFYFKLLKFSIGSNNSFDKEQIMLSRLLLGCTLSLMFSMFVVGGMAEIHDSEYVLLLGFILRRIDQFKFRTSS